MSKNKRQKLNDIKPILNDSTTNSNTIVHHEENTLINSQFIIDSS